MMYSLLMLLRDMVEAMGIEPMSVKDPLLGPSCLGTDSTSVYPQYRSIHTGPSRGHAHYPKKRSHVPLYLVTTLLCG